MQMFVRVCVLLHTDLAELLAMSKCNSYLLNSIYMTVLHRGSENQEGHGQTDAYYRDKEDFIIMTNMYMNAAVAARFKMNWSFVPPYSYWPMWILILYYNNNIQEPYKH